MSVADDPRAVLKLLEQRARRRFGQHFLARPSVVQRIVRAAGVRAGDRVVEIGPGLGILTEALLVAGAEVTAVEIDRDLAERLRQVLPAARLVEEDATRLDWRALLPGGGASMVANLPYNVGTGLVMDALRTPEVFDRVTVMLQAEVVERLVARPGTKAYGALSVEAWLWGEGRVVMSVPPEAFHPPPKVHSAVVRFDRPVSPRCPDLPAARVEGVARVAFASRRKTLRNNLGAAWGRGVAEEVLADAGIDPGLRAEALAPEAFVALARLHAGRVGPAREDT